MTIPTGVGQEHFPGIHDLRRHGSRERVFCLLCSCWCSRDCPRRENRQKDRCLHDSPHGLSLRESENGKQLWSMCWTSEVLVKFRKRQGRLQSVKESK